MNLLEPGLPAPDFSLPGLNGRQYSLTERLASGPAALAFFKKSCAACAITFPFLQRIYSARSKSGPELLGVSQDSSNDTVDFRDRHGIEFPLLIEAPPYPVSSLYGLSFVPTVFLIETSGKVAWAEVGFSKPALRRLAGVFGVDPARELFDPSDALPETRPG